MAEVMPALTDRLLQEFRSNPFGARCAELTRLVNWTRMGPVRGRFVLVTLIRHKEWVLAQLPGTRGGKVTIHWEQRFTDLAVAEWYVFCLRWKELTGETLESGPVTP